MLDETKSQKLLTVYALLGNAIIPVSVCKQSF